MLEKIIQPLIYLLEKQPERTKKKLSVTDPKSRQYFKCNLIVLSVLSY